MRLWVFRESLEQDRFCSEEESFRVTMLEAVLGANRKKTENKFRGSLIDAKRGNVDEGKMRMKSFEERCQVSRECMS